MSSAGTPGETGSRAMPAANPSKSKEEVRQLVASDDGRDLEFAERGFIATRKDPLIRGSGGRTVYDLSSYRFVSGAAPDTVNPSLWRQARIITRHGLFKVAEGICRANVNESAKRVA